MNKQDWMDEFDQIIELNVPDGTGNDPVMKWLKQLSVELGQICPECERDLDEITFCLEAHAHCNGCDHLLMAVPPDVFAYAKRHYPFIEL